MGLIKKTLLGTGAALVSGLAAQAADLPVRKAAPVEYVRVCDAYGQGFFFIPGTNTCLRVGGYVRAEYDLWGERNNLLIQRGGVWGPTTDLRGEDTVGFYARGTARLDARTQTAWGTVQAFMALRMDSGSGLRNRGAATATTGFTPEAAFIRFAGFTFGQAAQPFAFMSAWSFFSHYWTGWPNGVRQLSYTHTFGGGLSATVGITDALQYGGFGGVGVAAIDPITGLPLALGLGGVNRGAVTPGSAFVFVGTLNYDQAWGRLQLAGAYGQDGWAAGGLATRAGTIGGGTFTPAVVQRGGRDGWALSLGAEIRLPMLARGSSVQMQVTYADRLTAFLHGAGGGIPGRINTPSQGAFTTDPLGGPSTDFSNAYGWNFGAQARHYWTPTLYSTLMGSYVTLRHHNEFAAGTVWTGGRGTAWSISAQPVVWEPVSGFFMGLEVMYLRATWNRQAVELAPVGDWQRLDRGHTEDNWVGRIRVQRTF